MTKEQIREYFLEETKEPIIKVIIVKDLETELVYEKEIFNSEYVAWLEQKFVDLVTP